VRLAVDATDARDTASFRIVGTSEPFEVVDDQVRVREGAVLGLATSPPSVTVEATDGDRRTLVRTLTLEGPLMDRPTPRRP